jgi:hypothetical protein
MTYNMAISVLKNEGKSYCFWWEGEEHATLVMNGPEGPEWTSTTSDWAIHLHRGSYKGSSQEARLQKIYSQYPASQNWQKKLKKFIRKLSQ